MKKYKDKGTKETLKAQGDKKGTKRQKDRKKRQKGQKYRYRRDKNTGTKSEKRSLISQIVKIQVHVQWVKSDRTIESALKSVLEIIICSKCFF
jgi:hypothetical protein